MNGVFCLADFACGIVWPLTLEIVEGEISYVLSWLMQEIRPYRVPVNLLISLQLIAAGFLIKHCTYGGAILAVDGGLIDSWQTTIT